MQPPVRATPLFGEFSWVWLGLAVLMLVSAIVAPGTITQGSLLAMLPFAGILAIAAVGQTLVIQQRGLDMSAIGMVSLAGVLMAHFGARQEIDRRRCRADVRRGRSRRRAQRRAGVAHLDHAAGRDAGRQRPADRRRAFADRQRADHRAEGHGGDRPRPLVLGVPANVLFAVALRGWRRGC